ncbi:ArsR family transcriptional regulator [Halosimplex halophilum]|uniref:ArsR family transcriptional regulator n=1 Tax=Halosimplex halophilum TaxID=2559572 RepID=UPI001FE2675D|nr:ArsR family transcriptional regulator [Halosimplex halophilum]
MSVWDDRILEWMRENEGSGTPKQLNDSGLIRVSQTHIARRCKTLAENGLLRHVGNGAYVITEKGEAYLEEEYDAEEEAYIDDGNSTANGPSASEQGTNGV